MRVSFAPDLGWFFTKNAIDINLEAIKNSQDMLLQKNIGYWHPRLASLQNVLPLTAFNIVSRGVEDIELFLSLANLDIAALFGCYNANYLFGEYIKTHAEIYWNGWKGYRIANRDRVQLGWGADLFSYYINQECTLKNRGHTKMHCYTFIRY